VIAFELLKLSTKEIAVAAVYICAPVLLVLAIGVLDQF
jgi:hypothetical protein